MKEKLIQSIMNIKGCDRAEAIRMLLVAANEWESKRLRMKFKQQRADSKETGSHQSLYWSCTLVAGGEPQPPLSHASCLRKSPAFAESAQQQAELIKQVHSSGNDVAASYSLHGNVYAFAGVVIRMHILLVQVYMHAHCYVYECMQSTYNSVIVLAALIRIVCVMYTYAYYSLFHRVSKWHPLT